MHFISHCNAITLMWVIIIYLRWLLSSLVLWLPFVIPWTIPSILLSIASVVGNLGDVCWKWFVMPVARGDVKLVALWRMYLPPEHPHLGRQGWLHRDLQRVSVANPAATNDCFCFNVNHWHRWKMWWRKLWIWRCSEHVENLSYKTVPVTAGLVPMRSYIEMKTLFHGTPVVNMYKCLWNICCEKWNLWSPVIHWQKGWSPKMASSGQTRKCGMQATLRWYIINLFSSHKIATQLHIITLNEMSPTTFDSYPCHFIEICSHGCKGRGVIIDVEQNR